MNVSIFDNRRVRQGLTILMLSGVLTCIFPPKHPAFQWWAGQAVVVALSFLLLGLFFLTINKSRLMFVCLGCSAAISFLKHEMREGTFGKRHPLPISSPIDTPYQNQMHQDSFLLKPAAPDESSKKSQ